MRAQKPGLCLRFCLVSSDGDFTRLAARIREEGMDVFGFGEQKTPESFRQACKRFIYTENLLPEAQAATPGGAEKSKKSLAGLKRTLTKIVSEMESEDAWVDLGPVGQQLANLEPDFDPRSFGFKKLSELVGKIETIELQQSGSGHLRVRLRSAKR